MTSALPARIADLRARSAARAEIVPSPPCVPFRIGTVDCGLASPAVAGQLARDVHRFALRDGALVLDDSGLTTAGRTRHLDDAARSLLAAGLVGGWRDEQLDVRPDPSAPPLGTIERAACRALGIATLAVHLNGFVGGERLWVARRSPHKQIDPGMWDTLVGGMVPAGEGEYAALAREAVEEAGLDLALLRVVAGSRLRFARPVPEGYQIEIIQVFDAVLPEGLRPANQDGEVAEIALRSVNEVLDAIDAQAFTLEAALVTLDGLARRVSSPQTAAARRAGR
jgi:8-oxo-dGTP pyrophosphatase MutT (NUDIX family)